jgi:hypothetical protein
MSGQDITSPTREDIRQFFVKPAEQVKKAG